MNIAIEVAHWMALVPLLFLLLFRRDVGVVYWLVAWGFGASWFADTVAEVTEGAWVATQYLPGFQLGAFGAALGAGLWFPLALIAVSLVMDPVLVTLLGSAVVVWYAAGHRFRNSMVAYSGVGSLFLFWFVASMSLPAWFAYQAMRALGIGLFIREASA